MITRGFAPGTYIRSSYSYLHISCLKETDGDMGGGGVNKYPQNGSSASYICGAKQYHWA